MAGASGEGGGPGSCGAPLEVCGSVCVDLVTDPRHCGACGHECPTGLCESGACLGGLPGHIVVLCSSYEEVQQQHPQTVLLGNAVFLSRTDPVRILAYTEHSESGAVGRIVQVLDWATEIKGQASMLATAPAAAQIPTTLSLETFDVFLVLDQPLAPAGELARIGAAWAATLDTFVGEGGTVVVLQGAGGAGEMASLVSGAQLFDVDGQNPLASGEVLYNRAPSDSVGMSVLSPFRPLAGSCRLETAQAPDMSTVFVVTDTAPGGALGNPSTVHRVRGY